jgi:hypothetical protein
MGKNAFRAACGPAAWLQAACAPAATYRPRLERTAGDGRRAALVETRDGSGLTSHVRVAPPDDAGWQDVAAFEGRVEAMEWQGADLLLGFAAGDPRRVFSVFPGLRVREADGSEGLRWLRISTRRSRR